MYETYKMLGEERRADFAREAEKAALAAEAKGEQPSGEHLSSNGRLPFRARFAGLLARVARAS